MGRRGPAPTPRKLLLLRGSSRATAGLGDHAAQPPAAKPGVPSFVKESKAAMAVWRSLVDELDACGILTKVDQLVLGRYCLLTARWLECEEWIRQHGHGFPVYGPAELGPDGKVVLDGDGKPVRPLVAVRSYPHARQANVLAAQLLVLERELGLTPAARSRIFVDKPDQGGRGGEPEGFFSFG